MSIGIGLQALGAGWQGGDPGSVIERQREQLESAERKKRVASLLERMNISGPQRAILETMPAAQVPGLLWQMQQQEMARRAAGGAAAAKAAQERAAAEQYSQMFAGLSGGAPAGPSYSTGVAVDGPMTPSAPLSFGQSVEAPTASANLSFGEIAPREAPVASPYERYKRALDTLMMQPPPPPGTPERSVYDATVKDLTSRMEYFAPEEETGIDYTLANTYRDDLKAEDEVANFRLVRDGFDTVQTLYTNPGAVSDYGLAVAFAKIIDPGSVAREGEVAAVQKSPSITDTMRAQLLNVIEGKGSLPPEVRTEIADISSKFYNRRAERAGGILESYRRRAERAGLPFDEIWAGGEINPLPDDWLETLTISPTAKDRFAPPQPGPAQGPPPPQVMPQPAPLPSAPTAALPGPVMPYTETQMAEAIGQMAEAIGQLSPGDLALFRRMKKASDRLDFLRRKGLIE